MYREIRNIKPKVESVTQKRLKEVLDYNKDTGIFTWILRRQGVKLGKIAGYKQKIGYVVISVDQKDYKAHRLAWLYIYGHFPKYQIDHINQKKDDNRICNLRDVTVLENGRNRKISNNNTSRIQGVSWNKGSNKWQAGIMINQKAYNLGTFKNKEDAIKARKEAEIKYGFHKNHGNICIKR